ncbi:hypothetical protein Cgig2_034048 [Carnegiea gigantea]|uniref:Uncharacterized protein n=1 Tax=Carnegiea gigantea TaxID=171969 RepID=A0A9Q1KL64_9CARY|nr:hypothetical protein Cgig2_034048 [Carnegiea gigantea]
MANQGSHVTVPTMVFNVQKGPHFVSSHNDLLVVEMKVASTIIHRILIDTGSSMNIITWDYLKKLKYPRRKLLLWYTPFWASGAKRDKAKVRNLEVDFLVANVPTAYNATSGRPTLHKVKAFEADDGSIGKLQGDQWTARECCLVSILPLVEQSIERGTARPPPSDKQPTNKLKTTITRSKQGPLYVKRRDPHYDRYPRAPQPHCLHLRESQPRRLEAWYPRLLDRLH